MDLSLAKQIAAAGFVVRKVIITKVGYRYTLYYKRRPCALVETLTLTGNPIVTWFGLLKYGAIDPTKPKLAKRTLAIRAILTELRWRGRPFRCEQSALAELYELWDLRRLSKRMTAFTIPGESGYRFKKGKPTMAMRVRIANEYPGSAILNEVCLVA